VNANTDKVATLSFLDDNGVDVSVIKSAGDVTLSSTARVTQSAAPIQATGLELLGVGGTYTLDTQNNAITTLAGSTGTVSFRDDTGFTIGTVNTIGLTTSGATTLQTLATVDETAPLAATTLTLKGAGATYSLGTQNNNVTTLNANTDQVATLSFR